jgi:hypothetical protein
LSSRPAGRRGIREPVRDLVRRSRLEHEEMNVQRFGCVFAYSSANREERPVPIHQHGKVGGFARNHQGSSVRQRPLADAYGRACDEYFIQIGGFAIFATALL